MSTMFALRLYCEVDASYLLHRDSKGHTGYTISFYGTTGIFHNRSVKQTAVATSLTHAEARTIFTLLAKELNFQVTNPRTSCDHHGEQQCCGNDGQQRLGIHQEVQTLLDGTWSSIISRIRSPWARSRRARSTVNLTTLTCTPRPSEPPNLRKWL